jgi:hypothetical protein
MAVIAADMSPMTLLDHQWIHTDQAVEYLKAIKDRNDKQLRDFGRCSLYHMYMCLTMIFSCTLLMSSTSLSSGAIGWTDYETVSLQDSAHWSYRLGQDESHTCIDG